MADDYIYIESMYNNMCNADEVPVIIGYVYWSMGIESK